MARDPGVLLVERDPSWREQLASQISRIGEPVFPVGDLAEGLRVLGRTPYRVAVLPAQDGEAGPAEIIRRARGARPHVEIVLMARVVGAAAVREAQRAGAVDFFDVAGEPLETLVQAVVRARYRHTVEESRRHLVESVRSASDLFLRTVVRLERRTLDLETEARGEDPDPPYRILLADADEASRLSVGGLLRADGLGVDEAGHGDAALGLLDRSSYQMAIVDGDMQADGTTLFDVVGRRIPEAALVLLVGTRAVAAPDDAVVLRKPFPDLADVAARIRFQVAQHRRLIRARAYLESIKERHGDLLERYEALLRELDRVS
jgi:DNA-binding NtrC family response regulator